MSETISRILLWLFVINLGIAFGAGLYEHCIVVSQWITSTEAGAHWKSVSTSAENLTVPPGENLTDRRGDERPVIFSR
jgi:hypothetical protein